MIAGSITSSIRYNNLKLGKAIATNTNAGVTVQINSITVPCVKYLYTIGLVLVLNLSIIVPNIQDTPITIITK